MRTIGDNLRWFRMNLGMGSDEFGRLFYYVGRGGKIMRYRGTDVRLMESGKRVMSGDFLRRVARYFKIDISLLAEFNEVFDYGLLRQDVPEKIKKELNEIVGGKKRYRNVK